MFSAQLITACSSARGESGTTDLSTSDKASAEECAGDDIGCCAEEAEEKAKDACCEEGDALAPTDN